MNNYKYIDCTAIFEYFYSFRKYVYIMCPNYQSFQIIQKKFKFVLIILINIIYLRDFVKGRVIASSITIGNN